ncbi:MAG TPA: PAS domain S-box protein [Bryobacteraceae bacterium]|jgi:PAS domain S-box-containing protein|nr:PAS domain S-box protein [Bryobacteraceae bacterium]
MKVVALRLHGRIDRLWRFLAIGIVLVIFVLFYADWRAFQNASKQVDETRQLQKQTDAVLSSVTDAETGERGYLLTGDPQYLAPYEKANADLPDELKQLAQTAAAAGRDVDQVRNIQTVIHDKMNELKRTIELRDQQGADAALASMRDGEGRLTMDEVRSDVKVMLSGEYMSLYQLETASELHADRSRIIVLVGCLGLVFLLFRMGSAIDSVVREREEFAGRIEDSRQLLETTLASIGDAVIVTDADGAVRFMNSIAGTMTGWVPADAARQPLSEIFQIIDERTRKPIENPFEAVQQKAAEEMAGGASAVSHQHTTLIARDGGEISIEDSSAPIRAEGRTGQMLGAVIVFRDVTARRIAERELERWKQIFSGAGFGMFVADSKTGVIVDMNRTFAAMHGYSVDELLGTRLHALLPPETREDFGSALRIASQKGRHMFEHQHLRRDGAEFPSLVDVTTFLDGRDEFLAGYCSDITERKRFEDAIKESEERFRTLASALPQLVWSTDAAGNIEYVNERWVAYAGWRSGDEARKYAPRYPWQDLIHPEDREEYFARWGDSLGRGNTFEVQVRLRRAGNGAWRWFLCRAVAVRDRAGEIVRWLGGCTDIQEQMEGATQLRQANEALQRSNADLEQFAYAASHDLQEPLRMVSIYSQLLREEYERALDSRALSYIDFAINGAKRMSHLLTALLTYSRVANAARPASPKSDAVAAVGSALLNLSTIIEDTQALIEFDTLPVVQVPEIHLVQLFQNLIGNALKYRKEEYPPGERPVIRIDAKPRGEGGWLFSVTDNGIGIEAEYLTQIFGIFKRLHGSAFDGTGIGLALCQKIVERAGGRIWAESQPGVGTTFFFTLQGVEAGDYELAYHNSAGRG